MVIIPNFDFPAYVETVVIDNVPYIFGFTWNTRDESWSMSMTRGIDLILASVKVVNSVSLLELYASELLPNGIIMTLDVENIGQKPNRDQLGTAIKLAYVTEDELENGIV